MIHPERIQPLNPKPAAGGRYVLYWMQASQRAACNHALEFAVREADALGRPVVVGFGLTRSYPDARLRHYAFMLEGLAETAAALRERGIRFVLRRGSPEAVAAELAAEACLVVTDCGYLRHQRTWRAQLAAAAPCRVVQVETDVLVPVLEASEKAEYAARTIRPKLRRLRPRYLAALEETPVRRDSLGMRLAGERLDDLPGLLAPLEIDRSVRPVRRFRGGTAEAARRLTDFIRHRLRDYADRRNDPGLDIESHMSPYLHFGQISPLQIALAIRAARNVPNEAKDAYLEELLVRRELAMNFVTFRPNYGRFAGLPRWSRITLKAHAADPREYVYSRRQLEAGRTHDPFFNAAMAEMRETGKMHNYMRMYWGKKILEWSPCPQTAFRRLLALNNKYFLDGRDPVSYANVAWIFGLHDRPWAQRPVFGTVRYMNAAGLNRKFDMNEYLSKVDRLTADEGGIPHP